MEKIFRTLDSLKMPTLSSLESSSITSSVVAASDSVKTQKKERISHCMTVTDAVCSTNIQNLAEYSEILQNVTEVLFQLCNDSDSDIRLVATDCLHRIVRTVRDQYQHKFQVELHNEIKRNQSPRSLKIALNLFAFMSPFIRPQKCSAFVSLLLPCFAKISKRTEEALYENLAPAFCEIFKNLGPFLNDNQVKILCKDFLSNLESSSAIIRRSSASILTYICQYSRKPHVFLPKLLNQVTELLMPNLMEKKTNLIIGVLLCVRQCIQPIFALLRQNFEKKSPDQDSVVKNLIQIYECCMLLCNHDDHNVITTSLDTLQQLLESPVEQVVHQLCSPVGIQNSLDAGKWEVKANEVSSSMSSLDYSDATNLLEGDSDLPNFRSLIFSNNSEVKDDFDVDISFSSSRRNSEVFQLEDTRDTEFGSSLEVLQQSDDEQQRKSTYSLALQNFPEIHIGSLYDSNIPLYYCARFLAYNFLLAGQKGHERPDSEVRISVKVLATNCLINLIKIRPEIFCLPLSVKENIEDREIENKTEGQTIHDMLLYLRHSDPLLRGVTYILLGNLIKSIQEGGLDTTKTCSIEVNDLIKLLNDGLKDTSNIGVKCAISAISCCLIPLLRTKSLLPTVSAILHGLLVTAINSYWLIKVDLVEVLAAIEWDYIPDKQRKQKEVMNVLLDLLSDEDVRVRTATASALIKFIKFGTSADLWNQETILCERCVINQINKNLPLDCTCESVVSTSSHKLESVITEVLHRLGDQEEKYAIAGFYFALASLSENFPPKKYRLVWRCEQSPEVCSLFSIAVDTLRSSPIVYDVSIHQSILSLACNIFTGFISNIDPDTVGSSSEGNLFYHPDAKLSNHGIMLFHHCLAVMRLYQSLIESTSFHSKKVSSSPVLSPVKKFSQKLENEKKALESENADKKNRGLALTGSTSTCPQHFKQIGEALSQSWKVYKSNLDPAVTAKFTGLLITSLNGLGQLFTYIRSDYVGLASLIDEIFTVTSTLCHICPIPTLRCVQKMLNCLFAPFKSEAIGAKSLTTTTVALFEDIKDPIEKFIVFADVYHKTLLLNRRSVVVKTPTEKSALGSYIRQFEPIVVTALRMYTTTGDVAIQSEVLRLLSQLIKGHVNYGLVDKSQVFLGFVIKQIGFLEEGQIRTDGEMVEEMFEFLTLLSHEQHHSNRFIDIPKILRLCDGLGTSSGQNPVTHCIPALKRVVHDLFIQRSQSASTHVERKELETQREVLFQMLMKLSSISQTLVVLWVVIQGRRDSNELKWQEDSSTITAHLLPLIENSELQIATKLDFCNLIALLFSVNPTSLPPIDNIVAKLNEAIAMSKHTTASDFFQWQLLVTSNWLILVKLVITHDGSMTENDCTATFVLKLLQTFVDKLFSIIKSSFVEIRTNRPFMMELLTVFLQSMSTFIRKGKHPTLTTDLQSEDNIKIWISIVENLVKLSVLNPAVISNIVELLAVLLYPNIVVWLSLIQLLSEYTPNFLPQILIRLMVALNDADVPTLEEWITAGYTTCIMSNLENPTVFKFISRSSKFRIQTMLEEINTVADSEVHLEFQLAKNILKFMEIIHENFVNETAILSIKLLMSQTEPFLLLEIQQFSSFVFRMCKTNDVKFASSDKLILTQFLSNSEIRNKYPRLVNLVEHCISKESDDEVEIDVLESMELNPTKSPISSWCCSEVNKIEGIALGKLLFNLSYTQLMKIFKQPDFNLSLLSSCISHLETLFLKGKIDAEDIVDLLSEKRSCLIDKCPLGVATFDYIVEKLDRWENSISHDILNTWNDAQCDKCIEEIPFAKQLPDMWGALETILKLKEAVIKSGVIERKSCGNNFIATNFFTFSFQYMRVKTAECKKLVAPNESLEKFLSFASAVVSDSSFMKFFNVRDEPEPIFTCTRCLGCILRHIVRVHNINFTLNTAISETWWLEMGEPCALVLTEFSYLSHFIQNVENRKLSLDNSLFSCFRNVVTGIGKCDIINQYILISHLGWKPVTQITSTGVFPPVKQIPLDILQNEKDLLLQYIFKLNLFGAASKVQFEENWMTFLSVINSYGDENSPLQIVCIGLRALSMIVEKTVKFVYVPLTPAENSMRGLANISLSLAHIEPSLCKHYNLVPLLSGLKKTVDNFYEVDFNSCIRFLTDLFSQWLQNPMGKMPLLLLSEVVQSIVKMAEYFEDVSQFTWMFDTLMEILRSFEKEDEILWPHLIYGIFYAASKISVEVEPMNNLAQILDGALVSPYISTAAVQSSLIFLQHHPDNLQLLNVITPYVLKNTHLSETINDSEIHSCAVWKLLLFIWIHGPSDNIGGLNFEQETLSNILTALSPLNKVNVSVRLLVLKGLQQKIQMKTLTADSRRKIAKATFDTLKTTNICIFFETIKLFAAIYYTDFEDFYQVVGPYQEPEILMQMVERTEVLFQLLKYSTKYNSLIVSKVLPHIMMDFLPPSEILNRVIAEFLSPSQNNPELLAPVVAQLFEKARRKPKEAALVREWILSSVPNFVSNPDVSRVTWSLTLFFIGVSQTAEVFNLLPFAELRRSFLINNLLMHSCMDFYFSLNTDQKEEFKMQLEKGEHYKFLIDCIVESETSSSET